MSQGSRPDRVADQIRGELATLLAREVHDPGIGFVTLTRVQVSPDLQQARVFYTALGPTGDEARTRRNSGRALERATPFLRRQIGSRLRLRRVPELRFIYDESIAGQDRIEQLLNELHASDAHSPDRGDESEREPSAAATREDAERSALGVGPQRDEKTWGPASRKE